MGDVMRDGSPVIGQEDEKIIGQKTRERTENGVGVSSYASALVH